MEDCINTNNLLHVMRQNWPKTTLSEVESAQGVLVNKKWTLGHHNMKGKTNLVNAADR